MVRPLAAFRQPKMDQAIWFARAVDGALWELLKEVDPTTQGYPRTVAVFIGNFHKRLGSNSDSESSDTSFTGESDSKSDSAPSPKGSLRLTYDPSARYKFMLIKEHLPAKFHVASYFVIGERRTRGTWSKRLEKLPEYSFCIGGPAI